MAAYKPKVISLTKRPGQTFGFYLRVEHGEDGHLIRCLEMGGPAELAGMKDGDRIIRVGGAYVDGLPHSQVVEMVRNSGASVTFHILDEASYKKAKAKGVNLSNSQGAPVSNGVSKPTERPKLCYLEKSSSDFGFSIRSVKGEKGLFMTEVTPGSIAHKAGVRVNDCLLEVNGQNIENMTHDQVVEKINLAGNCLMFLLVDEETDKQYNKKLIKIGAWLATTKYLPHKPRNVHITRESDGYGFFLRKEPKQTGHFIKNIDKNGPADAAGLKEMDRVVAVDEDEVESCTYEQVVDKIKKSGRSCSLLVVDKETDQMYKLGKVSPMLFLKEIQDSTSPPSYTEAISSTAQVQTSESAQVQEEELKPKLCRMVKGAAGYGFHLNGIQGEHEQYIKEVVKGGVADRAGMEDDDIVVEVDGVNVEQSTHEEVVQMIRNSGDSLEMLVANRSVYDRLKAKGVTITRLLIGETSYAQVHKANTPETIREETHEEEEEEEEEEEARREERHEEEARSESPAEPPRRRTSSAASSASEASLDERF